LTSESAIPITHSHLTSTVATAAAAAAAAAASTGSVHCDVWWLSLQIDATDNVINGLYVLLERETMDDSCLLLLFFKKRDVCFVSRALSLAENEYQ
jgi:hypothetical protein